MSFKGEFNHKTIAATLLRRPRLWAFQPLEVQAPLLPFPPAHLRTCPKEWPSVSHFARRRALALVPALVASPLLPAPARAAGGTLRVLRSPGCMCCEGWAEHLRSAGFTVLLEDALDLDGARRAAGVPEDLVGCHTGSTADGRFVVEGHVPAFALQRFLDAPGSWRGIAVPDMPIGSPGMEMPGTAPRPYTVYVFTADGRREPFVRARGDRPA